MPDDGQAFGSLPRPLAFLTGHGVPETRLVRANAAALAAGVDPVSALLRLGLLSETSYYRALARELGVAFLDGPLDLGPAARYPESLTGGAAPLLGPGPRFVLAPAGPEIAELLADPRRGRQLYAITDPGHLRDALFAARPEVVAETAAYGLRRRASHWCYLPGFTLAQATALVVGLIGLVLLVRAAPLVVETALVALIGLLFLAITALRLGSLLVVAPLDIPPPRRQDDRELPVYTILVALYREASVVPRLVRALAGLDYPPAKLDIKFVVEAEDRETRDALAAIPLPGRVEVVVAPPGRPRTKPRALNVALPLAKGALLVVFDAEDVPDPGQLRAAASAFARLSPQVACLQGRLVIDNTDDGVLPLFFTLEYTALFDVLGPALAAWEMPYPLGGTSTHFRTGVLRRLHGWDAWNVTEDADLGIRLALQGYRVGDLPSATIEEAPARLGAWMRQRTRWMKGYMQVCVTHSRRPVASLARVGFMTLFGAFSVTFGAVIAALGYPFMIGVAVVAFLSSAPLSGEGLIGNVLPSVGFVVFAAGLGAMILPPMVGALRRGWWDLALLAPLMPFYFILISAAAWIAFVELLRDPTHWHKTEHGLARTSRSGALLGPSGRGRGRRPRPPGGGRG